MDYIGRGGAMTTQEEVGQWTTMKRRGNGLHRKRRGNDHTGREGAMDP